MFAILGAFSFGFNGVTTRRAVTRIKDPTMGVFITVFISVPIFFIILLIAGRVHTIAEFSPRAYGFLIAAGILHFIFGRSFSYACTKLVGSNIRSVVTRTNLLIAVILGIIIFHEPVTWRLITGVSLVLLGLIIVGWAPNSRKSSAGGYQGISLKGVMMGLIGGVFWGITPLLVKAALNEGGYPVAGTFISYAAAALALCPILLFRSKRKQLHIMDRSTVLWFCSSGFTSAMAQLFRYMALSMTHVSVVAPLFSTNPLFVVGLSFIFNRKLESFRPQVLIGVVAVVIGAILVY
ncbi:MAG: EamA family transporter [Dehalococcoidia bacterium]|nr:EamA family transporter [Dehalococcoidia bacterium]